ncbi:hypothetical protein HK096_010937, partial [Nowakowskiella sp. JEL0078]
AQTMRFFNHSGFLISCARVLENEEITDTEEENYNPVNDTELASRMLNKGAFYQTLG